MKNFSSIISLILIISATGIVLANDECYCSAGCKSRGDPHVRDFSGVESKIPDDGIASLYNLHKVQIETHVTAQNKGLYQTHFKIYNGTDVFL